jgi:prepilin-type N-terminal cleavage/methylation domain-containing protein/prepilin-type processing-associated H-X9-DG protein
MRRPTAPRGAAFTLVELLVVIGIIAILAGMAYPIYQRTVASGRAAACLSNLRQLGVGLNAYLNDNEMRMPTLKIARESTQDDVPVIDNTLDRYITDRAVFACPADAKGFAASTGTSYCWNILVNDQLVANLRFLLVTDPTRIPVISDKEGFHPYLEDKINVLYADGHATKDVKFSAGN